jgi:hypothetical protein
MRLRASMLPRRKRPNRRGRHFSGWSSLASGSGPWPITRPLGDDDAIYYKLRNLFAPAGGSDQPLEDGRNRVRPIHKIHRRWPRARGVHANCRIGNEWPWVRRH